MHEKISQTFKDAAKKGLEDVFNSKLVYKKRLEGGVDWLAINGLFLGIRICAYYLRLKKYLKKKFGIKLKWLVITLLTAWFISFYF